MIARQISAKGLAFLEAHEGVVLKAYRDAVGVWTIGAGLTAASGVVKPKPGMVITRAEASELLGRALRRSYEPRVTKAMGDTPQCAFDGAVSFDYNTGAIDRASWVKRYKDGNASGVAAGLAAWCKGGGRVLPGLQRRRKEEAEVILYDRWPANLKVAEPAKAEPLLARFVISVAPEEIAAIRDGFRAVGFEPGDTEGQIRRDAVEAFQRKYALTVDGLIGKATLSTLQRELDARKAGQTASLAGLGSAGALGGSTAAGPVVDGVAANWIAGGALALAAAYGLWKAWQYRDVIAAIVADRAPRAADWLRSV